METMEMKKLFGGIYSGRRVLLTGHTGFKGSWLAHWLSLMGADVLGYALAPATDPNHFLLLKPDIKSVTGDIRDREHLAEVLGSFKPEMVFHLAAQPLVRYSYDNPVETYETNVIGTLNIFEACRKCDTVKAIVNVTSDKCYDNKEWIWGYRENDPMGGYDPYSSSKGCSEILTASYRNSYFNNADYGIKHNTLLASCRAGNVIGGGDWAMDRLMTDIMLSVNAGRKVSIRSPYATRPWQHVLEPLSGYLNIGQKLLECKKEYAEGWNFGPEDEGSITVKEVVENVKRHWDEIDYEINTSAEQPHEANLLKLDCSKSHIRLKWRNVWSSQDTFKMTVEWYKKFYREDQLLTDQDLDAYVRAAAVKQIPWAMI